MKKTYLVKKMASRIRFVRGKALPANSIYCGRPSRWGNPYKMKNESERKKVIQLYEEWIFKRFRENPDYYLMPLLYKNLACWCAPDKACHVDVLVKYVTRAESYVIFIKAFEGPIIEKELVEYVLSLKS